MNHLLKIKKKNRKIKEAGDSWYVYKNKLDRACFQHNMVYGDFKDLADELHRPIIKNFKKRRANSSFKDNIWGVDLVYM